MPVLIGTRKSKLALWQANFVKRWIEDRTGEEVRLVKITTTGDKILDSPLAKIGGKGLFVKEIEQALLDGRIDLAVHSLKDVPMVIPQGLEIFAITQRDSPYDALISSNNLRLEELPPGSVVGTSSLRRQVQIKKRRRDLRVEVLRGNVDTRMRKLKEGLYDAIILAQAGVKRMGYAEEVTQVLEDFIPAVGQGSLAIEVREDDQRIKDLISGLDHRESHLCALCERAFLRRLEGGCQVPIGAMAQIEDGKVRIRGFISDLEGETFLEGEAVSESSDPERAGMDLAEDLLSRGGDLILKEIYGK